MALLWPGALLAQGLSVAAKLGLAELLEDGPKTAAELARATDAEERSLERLLRALTSVGVFAEDGDRRFHQTALSGPLGAGHLQSVRPRALLLGASFLWRSLGELEVAVRTGRPSFDSLFATSFFDYLADHDSDAALFDAAMAPPAGQLASIVAAYDFSRFERVVDVGGGRGALLAAVLSANPRLVGVLHDLPRVVATADVDATYGLGDRLQTAAGSFFDAVPPDGDLYLLHHVVHNWDDARASVILENCRRAIRPDGRLLIVEAGCRRSGDRRLAFMDLMMLLLTGGRERTDAELQLLLEQAGFSLTHVVWTPGGALFESHPR